MWLSAVSSVLYGEVWRCIVLYYIAQYSVYITVLYCTACSVLFCTVLYSMY